MHVPGYLKIMLLFKEDVVPIFCLGPFLHFLLLSLILFTYSLAATNESIATILDGNAN